ncbi:MAG: DUF1214 domain-containing protein [Caulobacterales bacterium]
MRKFLTLAAAAVLLTAGGAMAQTTPTAAPAATAAATSPGLRTAWDDYYKALDEARAQMEATPRFIQHPEVRAKAYHTLIEMQAMAYNFVVGPRMTNPRIYKNLSWQTNMYTLGQNGPDWDYRNLFVDGKQTYKLKGKLNGSKLGLIQVFNGVFGDPGVKTVGNYNLSEMKTNAEGTFEITVGGPKQDGNWIALDPAVDYQYLFFRFAMADWNDAPAEVTVERTSQIAPDQYAADEFDEAAVAKRITRAANFVRYITKIFNVDLLDNYIKGAKGVNKLSYRPGTTDGEVGSPSSEYALGTFDLKDDEALVLTWPKMPNGVYWSVQLGDVWSRSLGFWERHSSVNMAEAKLDSDGKLRMVITQKDPGVANWLDPASRRQGTVVFRNYVAKSPVVPTAKLVKTADLPKLLKGAAKVTPQEREADLAHRRAGLAKNYQ